jgi:hypothetical protein
VHIKHNSRLTRGWLTAFIDRRLDQLRLCRSLPQEQMRLIIPRAHVEAHIELMQANINAKFSELVLNLDEIDSSDWEDWKPRRIVATVTVSMGEVFHEVSRPYFHVALLTHVSTACEALTAIIIS